MMLLDLLMPGRKALTSEPGYVGDATFTSRVVSLDELRPTSSKVTVTEETAMTYSACWAATRILAGTIGWLPCNLYRGLKRGRELLESDHRNFLIYRKSNQNLSAMPFKMQAVNQQVNAGNCYAEIERDRGGRPLALWPIHHSRVPEIHRHKDTNKLTYEVLNDDGPPSYIPGEDMLHVPSIISRDGLVGRGVIRNARESIGLAIAQEQAGAAWFGTGGVPKVVLETTAPWSPESRANLRKEWKETYGGADGQKIGLLPTNTTAKTINVSNEDSQYLESRQHSVEEIARWYGVPPHMIGHLLRSTFNNIEHLGIDFLKYSLRPWLTLWEEELNEKLLTEEEQKTLFFSFDVHDIIRGDAKSMSEFYRVMIFIGAMTPNEVRDMEHLNPYEGGDQYVMQSAMVPVDMLGQVAAGAMTGDALPGDEPKEEKPDQSAMVAARAVAKFSESVTDRIGDVESGVTLAITELQAQVAKLQQPKDGREAALRAAAQAMLRGALARMFRVQAAQARNAAGKPDSFIAWLDGFFGDKHRETFQDAIAEPCQALTVLGMEYDAAKLASVEVEKSKAELLDASGCAPEKFTATVEAVVSEWEKNRAARVAESIVPQVAA